MIIEQQIPFRLKEGDVVTFGTTELKVFICVAGNENLDPSA
jgi:hypothetical protein